MKELRQEFQFNGEQCMHKNDKPRGVFLDFFISAEFSLGPIKHYPRTEKTAAKVWRTHS